MTDWLLGEWVEVRDHEMAGSYYQGVIGNVIGDFAMVYVDGAPVTLKYEQLLPIRDPEPEQDYAVGDEVDMRMHLAVMDASDSWWSGTIVAASGDTFMVKSAHEHCDDDKMPYEIARANLRRHLE